MWNLKSSWNSALKKWPQNQFWTMGSVANPCLKVHWNSMCGVSHSGFFRLVPCVEFFLKNSRPPPIPSMDLARSDYTCWFGVWRRLRVRVRVEDACPSPKNVKRAGSEKIHKWSVWYLCKARPYIRVKRGHSICRLGLGCFLGKCTLGLGLGNIHQAWWSLGLAYFDWWCITKRDGGLVSESDFNTCMHPKNMFTSEHYTYTPK